MPNPTVKAAKELKKIRERLAQLQYDLLVMSMEMNSEIDDTYNLISDKLIEVAQNA
jgi:hypothetical protein